MPTITDKTEGGEMIDIYKIYRVQNVTSYSLCGHTYNRWNIETEKESIEAGHMYFIIDTFYHEAFSHWVFESGVYLELFNKLRKLHPIKLVLKARRTYKLLFCKLFNINEEDIVYEIQRGNTCIFPSPISAMNDKSLSTQYTEQLTRFYKYFSQMASLAIKTNTIVLMPRQRKENYHGNTREYIMDNLITYVSSKKDSVVLYTDTITDLQEQIQSVASAKSLILSDESAFLVNGMFAYNAHLLVLGKVTVWQASEYPKLYKIRELSGTINNNTYVQYDTEMEILRIIREE